MKTSSYIATAASVQEQALLLVTHTLISNSFANGPTQKLLGGMMHKRSNEDAALIKSPLLLLLFHECPLSH